MLKYIVSTISLVLLLPMLTFAEQYKIESFIGEWCLIETAGEDDEYLELRFLDQGKLEYRINSNTNEFRQGTFSLNGNRLELKTKQGINFRTFKLDSITDNSFKAKYFLMHTFSKGLC